MVSYTADCILSVPSVDATIVTMIPYLSIAWLKWYEANVAFTHSIVFLKLCFS